MTDILRRIPVTLTVFVVTAALGTAQAIWPGLLTALERSPELQRGEPWRLVTALFVQDGGLAGTLSNLLFLAVVGGLAELALPAWRWLLSYFGTGLVGELVGLAWQPRGAGNSVAVCGLASALAIALSTLPRLSAPPGLVPRFAPVAVVWWCAALLAGLSVVAFVVGAVVAFLTPLLGGRLSVVVVGRVLAVWVLVVGLLLAVGRDIHGAALLAGLLIAAATVALAGPARAYRIAR